MTWRACVPGPGLGRPTAAGEAPDPAAGSGGGIDYSHMGVISRLPPGALWKWIVVWQAANVKEGEPDQRFLCSYSDGERHRRRRDGHHTSFPCTEHSPPHIHLSD